jgi:hypothetical protein
MEGLMAIKRTRKTLIGLVGAGVMAGSSLTGIGAAHAATGDCRPGFRISSPAKYRDTSGRTVVIGLKAPMRTVTFVTRDGLGCVLEIGDHWSASAGPHSKYFLAEGTYDGTSESLTDRVRVKLPETNHQRTAGVHMTLDDITGTDNDTRHVRAPGGLIFKQRTEWRGFNVFPESPTPACGSLTGTTLHAKAQIFHASWSGHAYHQYKDHKVRLMFKPGNGPIAPGHTAYDPGVITIAKAVTNAHGWAHFSFKPPSAGTYFAHYGGNYWDGISDSAVDFVNCTP